MRIKIGGYTDNTGDEAHNVQLSKGSGRGYSESPCFDGDRRLAHRRRRIRLPTSRCFERHRGRPSAQPPRRGQRVAEVRICCIAASALSGANLAIGGPEERPSSFWSIKTKVGVHGCGTARRAQEAGTSRKGSSRTGGKAGRLLPSAVKRSERLSIAIVDDDESLRRLLGRSLRAEGCSGGVSIGGGVLGDA